MEKKLRIVFMGTPEFAVASLDALLHAGQEVVAVVTSPDKPAGRGRHMQQSAIKQYAAAHGIPVLQPEKLKSPDFITALREIGADLQVVVAFRMLPEVVWSMPPKGTINLHASLLPQYRGAAPINHAVINGETESGVTTFLLQHDIDTGHILLQQRVSIGPMDTAGELHDQLMETGAQLLVRTVEELAADSLRPIPQEQLAEAGPLKHAPKIFKEDCLVNWDNRVATIYNKIRGLSPYPTAFTYLNGKTLKIFKATPEQTIPSHQPGECVTDEKSWLKFACRDGYIRVDELQLEGKQRNLTEPFLRGYRF